MPTKINLKPVRKVDNIFRPTRKQLNLQLPRFPKLNVLNTKTIELSKNGKTTIQAIRNIGTAYGLEGHPKTQEQEGNYTCDVYSFTGLLETHRGIMNRAAVENIYPGAIYHFQSIADGTFNDVDYKRKPIQLTTNNDFFPKKLAEVKTVNKGEVQQVISNMKGNAKPVDAQATRSQTEKIYSNEHFFMTTSGYGHYLTIGGSHSLDYSSEKKTHKYFCQFYQEYYTIAVNDTFHSLDDYFVTKEEAPNDNRAIPSKDINPNWVMIDAVTYGRMFQLLIESSEDLEQHGFSISAFAEFAVAGGGGDFTERQKDVLRKVTITFGAVGGDIAETALLSNPASVEDAKKRKDNYFKKPGGGHIIGYSLRTLDGDLVGFKMVSEFTSRQCAPRASKYKITWQQVQCLVNDDSDSTEDIVAKARIRVINGKGKDILDENRKNAPLLEWEKQPDHVKAISQKPWTFIVGSVQNPIELSDRGMTSSEKVDKSVTFAVPKDDTGARIAIRADVLEIDDTSGNDDFLDKTWERKISELAGAEPVELICSHEDSRIRFTFHVQPLYE